MDTIDQMSDEQRAKLCEALEYLLECKQQDEFNSTTANILEIMLEVDKWRM